MIHDVLYTPEEIAAKLKLTKGTVYEMIKRGDLNAHRIGRHLRVSESHYLHYLQSTSGEGNIFEGEIIRENDAVFLRKNNVTIYVETALEGDVKISIRPEHIILSKGSFQSSARNCYFGRVSVLSHQNGKVFVTVDIGVPIKACITIQSAQSLELTIGCEIYVLFKALSVYVYK